MAIRPPAPVLEAVARVAERWRAMCSCTPGVQGIRWTQPEQWHLTLAFLGAVPLLAPVLEGLGAPIAACASFEVRLGGAGAFPADRRARVLWLGTLLSGDGLTALAGTVAAALAPLGYGPGERFRPHLTLGRLRRPADVRPLLAALGPGPVGPSFTVSEVVLYESRLGRASARHLEIQRFPLGGSGPG